VVLNDDDVIDWDDENPPLMGDECPQGIFTHAHASDFVTLTSCNQMAGWILMSLGSVVGLGQSHIVRCICHHTTQQMFFFKIFAPVDKI